MSRHLLLDRLVSLVRPCQGGEQAGQGHDADQAALVVDHGQTLSQ